MVFPVDLDARVGAPRSGRWCLDVVVEGRRQVERPEADLGAVLDALDDGLGGSLGQRGLAGGGLPGAAAPSAPALGGWRPAAWPVASSARRRRYAVGGRLTRYMRHQRACDETLEILIRSVSSSAMPAPRSEACARPRGRIPRLLIHLGATSLRRCARTAPVGSLFERRRASRPRPTPPLPRRRAAAWTTSGGQHLARRARTRRAARSRPRRIGSRNASPAPRPPPSTTRSTSYAMTSSCTARATWRPTPSRWSSASGSPRPRPVDVVSGHSGGPRAKRDGRPRERLLGGRARPGPRERLEAAAQAARAARAGVSTTHGRSPRRARACPGGAGRRGRPRPRCRCRPLGRRGPRRRRATPRSWRPAAAARTSFSMAKGEAEPILERGPSGSSVPAEVDGQRHDAGLRVDPAGDSDTDAATSARWRRRRPGRPDGGGDGVGGAVRVDDGGDRVARTRTAPSRVG